MCLIIIFLFVKSTTSNKSSDDDVPHSKSEHIGDSCVSYDPKIQQQVIEKPSSESRNELVNKLESTFDLSKQEINTTTRISCSNNEIEFVTDEDQITLEHLECNPDSSKQEINLTAGISCSNNEIEFVTNEDQTTVEHLKCNLDSSKQEVDETTQISYNNSGINFVKNDDQGLREKIQSQEEHKKTEFAFEYDILTPEESVERMINICITSGTVMLLTVFCMLISFPLIIHVPIKIMPKLEKDPFCKYFTKILHIAIATYLTNIFACSCF